MQKIGSLLFGANEEIKLWVRDRIGGHLDISNGVSIGVVRGGRIIFGIVFFNYRQCGISVEVAFAADSPRWATRQNIHNILSYPFKQLNCARITGQILEGNRRSRRMAEGVGFVEEGIVRKAVNGENLIIYGLLKEEFENGRFGKLQDRQSLKPEQYRSRAQGVA